MCLTAINNLLFANLNSHSISKIQPRITKLVEDAFFEEDSEELERCLELLNLVLYSGSQIDNIFKFYFPLLAYMVIGRPNTDPTKDMNPLKLASSFTFFLNPVYESNSTFTRLIE